VWEDDDVPADAIWDAVSSGTVQPANQGTAVAPKAPIDALQTLETSTTSLVSIIISEQANTIGQGGPLNLSLASGSRFKIILPPRNVTVSELQRLKRHFVAVHRKAITQGAIDKGSVDWTEERISEKFVQYLEEHLQV